MGSICLLSGGGLPSVTFVTHYSFLCKARSWRSVLEGCLSGTCRAMDEVGFLVFAIASICALSIGGTVLPLWLRGTGRWNAMAIDVLTFFTGGVFLGAGMLHMLPEAAEQAEEAGVTSPLLNPFTCFCVGYLIVYAIEQHTEHQHPTLTKERRARAASAPSSLAAPPRSSASADGFNRAPAASSLPAELLPSSLVVPAPPADGPKPDAAPDPDPHPHHPDARSAETSVVDVPPVLPLALTLTPTPTPTLTLTLR